jgi:hypothetical protein
LPLQVSGEAGFQGLDKWPVDLLLESDSPVGVPEPSIMLLLGAGLASLALARVFGPCRRKRATGKSDGR